MMLRAVASAARRAPSHAVAQSSLAMLPRALSTKVVAHCVGPDRVGVLKDITQTVLGLGAKITDARAVCLDGTFSATTSLVVADDSCNIAWALQTKLPDYVCVVRPEGTFGATDVFGRLTVSGFKSAGAIGQLADHLSSRGLSFATFRITQGTAAAEGVDGVTAAPFGCAATLYSDTPVDFKWLEGEFAELGDKLDVHIKFEKGV